MVGNHCQVRSAGAASQSTPKWRAAGAEIADTYAGRSSEVTMQKHAGGAVIED